MILPSASLPSSPGEPGQIFPGPRGCLRLAAGPSRQEEGAPLQRVPDPTAPPGDPWERLPDRQVKKSGSRTEE